MASFFTAYQWRLFVLVCVFWAIDGSEMYVMSYVLPALPAAAWGLSPLGEGILGGTTYFGMMFGSVIFGWLSDYAGRLFTTRITLAIALIFALASACSSSALTLALLRGIFGFGIGGCMPAVLAHFVEASPGEAVCQGVAMTWCLFTVGGLYVTVLSVPVLDSLGWPWFVVLSALPIFIGLPYYVPSYIHESPTWLARTGRTAEAARVAAAIAQINDGEARSSSVATGGSSGPEDTMGAKATPLVADERGEAKQQQQEEQPPHPPAADEASVARGGGDLKEIFTSHWRVTLMLCSNFAVASFGYYGLVFAMPTFLANHESQEAEYWGSLLNAIVEIPAYLVGGFLADRLGRTRVLVWSYGLSAVFGAGMAVLALLMETTGLSWGWFLLASCLTKASISVAYLTAAVYAVEAYPTELASTGYGACSFFMRLAGVVTPSVGQVLLASPSDYVTFIVYSVACAVGAVLSALMPFETLGRDANAAEQLRGVSKSRPPPSERTPLTVH